MNSSCSSAVLSNTHNAYPKNPLTLTLGVEHFALRILRLLFKSPNIQSMNTLRNETYGYSCYHELHIGINITHTPFQYAYQAKGMEVFPKDKIVEPIYTMQQQFNQFLRASLQIQERNEDNGIINVSLINRRNTRRYDNLGELKQTIRQTIKRKHEIGFMKDVVLERMEITDRLNLLKDTHLFVCVHGTGCTDVIYLFPGSSVVIIYPKHWSGLRWKYMNLSRASGHRTFAYMIDESENDPFTYDEPTDVDKIGSIDTNRFSVLMENILESFAEKEIQHVMLEESVAE